MKKPNKILSALLTIVMIVSLEIPALADCELEHDDNVSGSDIEVLQENYENDPLYIKYINQPMTMASVSGSSTLKHNKTFDKADKVYGIDVSYFQGNIDWKKVKSSGIDFAIIRIGFRGYGNGALVEDARFKENLINAKAAGVGVGVYFFTQAITTSEAKQEAKFVLNLLKGYKLDLPVFFDIEELGYSYARFDAAKLSYNAKTNLCKSFCDTIEDAGYKAGIYANKYCLLYHFNAPKLAESYYIWLGHFTQKTNYNGTYQMWQYTGRGKVNGVSTKVDMNVLYINHTPEKVNNLQANGYGQNTTLTWDKSPEANGYSIYVKDLKTDEIHEVCKTTSNSKTVSIPYEKSKFYVKAYYNIGTKYIYSNSSSGVSVFKNYLPQVTGLKIKSSTANIISLTWHKLKKCTGYIIYKYDINQKKYIQFAKTNSNINSYKISALSSGTTYKFAVKAYQSVNEKEIISGSLQVITVTTKLDRVDKFNVVSSTADYIKLSWNKIKNADGYIIYKYDNSKKSWIRIAKGKYNGTYTVKKLKEGTSYKFAIKAYKTVSSKETTSYSYPQLTTSTSPATVSFKLTAGSRRVTVKWSRVTGASGYKVYYKTSKNGNWIGLKTANKKTTSYTKLGLTKGKSYYFTVKAYRTVGGKTYNGAFTTKSVKVK